MKASSPQLRSENCAARSKPRAVACGVGHASHARGTSAARGSVQLAFRVRSDDDRHDGP
jgi:hypothetical protein